MNTHSAFTLDEPDASLPQPEVPSETPTEEELSDQNLSQVDGAGVIWTVTSFGGTTSTVTTPNPPSSVPPTTIKGS
jgi:hypothetical protein